MKWALLYKVPNTEHCDSLTSVTRMFLYNNANIAIPTCKGGSDESNCPNILGHLNGYSYGKDVVSNDIFSLQQDTWKFRPNSEFHSFINTQLIAHL